MFFFCSVIQFEPSARLIILAFWALLDLLCTNWILLATCFKMVMLIPTRLQKQVCCSLLRHSHFERLECEDKAATHLLTHSSLRRREEILWLARDFLSWQNSQGLVVHTLEEKNNEASDSDLLSVTKFHLNLNKVALSSEHTPFVKWESEKSCQTWGQARSINFSGGNFSETRLSHFLLKCYALC